MANNDKMMQSPDLDAGGGAETSFQIIITSLVPH